MGYGLQSQKQHIKEYTIHIIYCIGNHARKCHQGETQAIKSQVKTWSCPVIHPIRWKKMKLNESGGHIIKVKFLVVGEARVSTIKRKESSSTHHVSAVSKLSSGHSLEEGCQRARFWCSQWPHKCALSSPLRPERLMSVLCQCLDTDNYTIPHSCFSY